MRVDNPSKERRDAYFAALDQRARESGSLEYVKYLDLGTHTVRLVCYSKDFTPHIEKQLTYVLRDDAPRYDATLVVWREAAFNTLSAALDAGCDPRRNLRLRVERLVSKRQDPEPLQVFDGAYSRHYPLINVDIWDNALSAHNPDTNTHYYAVENLEPEEFIKRGHIFIHALYKILKGRTSALVHGAAVGLNGRGILFCARGQRGKSTLAVKAMLDGFEYVSDDYLVLGKDDSGLYAWPIYSIITLSPRMYNELYYSLRAKFVSNNGRKDKYVLNIAEYHDMFRVKYPIKVCVFPQIVEDGAPGIAPVHKGRAVVHLVHSTTNQMGDRHDIQHIKKLMSFVDDMDFYQINLSPDIEANAKCLRAFAENIH